MKLLFFIITIFLFSCSHYPLITKEAPNNSISGPDSLGYYHRHQAEMLTLHDEKRFVYYYDSLNYNRSLIKNH